MGIQYELPQGQQTNYDPTLGYYGAALVANGTGAAPAGTILPQQGQFGQIATGAGAAPAWSILPPAGTFGTYDPNGQFEANAPLPLPLSQYPGSGVAPADATTSTDTGNGGSGGSGGGGGSTGGQGLFDPSLYAPFTGVAPTYTPPTLPNAPSFDAYYSGSLTAPTYNAPAYKQAPAFSYADFQAPTLAEAQNQPGYQFGVQQGEQALQQARAAQGLLRTGGTLKDILDYGRNAATQNYGNVFNQDLNTYNTNRAGAVQAYNTNYQTQYYDPNQFALSNAQDAFNAQVQGNNQALQVAQARFAPAMTQYQTDAANAQRQAELGYNADWQKYLNAQDVFYNNENAPFAKYLSLAQLGAANA